MDLQDLSEGKLQSSKARVLQAVEHQRSECTWLKTIAGAVDHQRSETIFSVTSVHMVEDNGAGGAGGCVLETIECL